MAIIRQTVVGAGIVDGSITADDLSNNSITTNKIADGNITTDKIADSNITTAKVADSNITTDKIADSNITTAKVADNAITVGHMHTSVPLGTKNLIINGDMRIAQRGTSITGINVSSTCQTVDRFALDLAGSGTWTQTQDTDVPTGQGFSSSVKMVCTTSNGSLAANAYNIFHQRVESQFLQHLKYGTANAESVTLSFWVKSNKTGTYIAELYSYGNYQISQSYAIDSADTWEKKTITYAGNTISSIPSNNSLGLYVNLFLAAGSDRSSGTLNTSWAAVTAANRAAGQVNLADSTSNYINITGVQLEVGDTATPFEHRPHDMELARCQRYYLGATFQIQGAFDSAYNTEGIQIEFPTTMRAGPSVDFYSYNKAGHIAGSNTSNPANDGVALTAFSATFRWNNSSAAYRPYGYVGAITVRLSAEL